MPQKSLWLFACVLAVAVSLPSEVAARKKQASLKSCKCACISDEVGGGRENNHHEFVSQGTSCGYLQGGSCQVYSDKKKKWLAGSLFNCGEEASTSPQGKTGVHTSQPPNTNDPGPRNTTTTNNPRLPTTASPN